MGVIFFLVAENRAGGWCCLQSGVVGYSFAWQVSGVRFLRAGSMCVFILVIEQKKETLEG